LCIVVISAAVGFLNENYDFQIEKDTIQINILGFTLISNLAISKAYITKRWGVIAFIFKFIPSKWLPSKYL